MATIHHDDDADLSVLEGETLAVVGYGNQGRSQALNLRDSGLSVIVGNIGDASREQAREAEREWLLMPPMKPADRKNFGKRIFAQFRV